MPGDKVNRFAQFSRVPRYQDDINRLAAEDGVDPKLVAAIVRAESSGNALARSSKGASGLMQVMGPTAKETAKELGMDKYNLKNPQDNLRIGIRYIKKQLAAHDGNIELALASYNAGPGNVRKYGGVPPFKETQNYVKKVRGYYGDGHGTPTPDKTNKLNPDTNMPQGSFEGAQLTREQ